MPVGTHGIYILMAQKTLVGEWKQWITQVTDVVDSGGELASIVRLFNWHREAKQTAIVVRNREADNYKVK